MNFDLKCSLSIQSDTLAAIYQYISLINGKLTNVLNNFRYSTVEKIRIILCPLWSLGRSRCSRRSHRRRCRRRSCRSGRRSRRCCCSSSDDGRYCGSDWDDLAQFWVGPHLALVYNIGW